MMTESSPLVSVVMPVWNAEATVERAIRSILDQSLREFEMIVVDDGSTDGTPDVVASIDDKRVHLHRTAHQGVAAAANAGVELASAPVIARMDADDASHSERLALQLACLRNERLDVVGSQVSIVSDTGVLTTGMKRYQRWINELTLSSDQIHGLRFVELPLVNPTLLGRREYFELGCRDNAFPEDYDLMLRAAANGMRFGKILKVLLMWSDRSARLTRTNRRYTRDAFMECRRHHILRGPLAGVKQVDLWGVGKGGKPWIRWLLENDIQIRTLIDVNPRKVGKTIGGTRVIGPADVARADGVMMLVAVGAVGARQEIEEFAKQRGYVMGRDLWFVA